MIRKKLLILNADLDREEEQHGNLANLTHGIIFNNKQNSDRLTIITYEIHQGNFPDPEEEFDGIIITGSIVDGSFSEETREQRLSWINQLLDYIRILIGRGTPVLGVCFGHEVISYAYGGSISTIGNYDNKEPIFELGYLSISLTPAGRESPLFQGFPDNFSANESHRFIVSKIPSQAILLAENQFGIQAFQLREGVFGIQFHPEIYLEQARLSLQNKIKKLSPGEYRQRFIRILEDLPEQYLSTQNNSAVRIYQNFINNYIFNKRG